MRTVNRSNKSGREMARLLAGRLDDRFTLVHHARLRGLKSPADAALVGPHGVTVLAVADDKDRVRCLGDKWYVYNPKVESFALASRNPVEKVRGDRAAMEAHVAARQMGSVVPVDCAVMVPDSRAQVEYMQSAVPVLDAGKIVELAEQLATQRELIEWTHAEDLIKSLGVTPLGIPWRQLERSAGRMRVGASRRMWGLTRPQLIILAAIAAADLLVLIGGLAVVLFTR